MQPLLSRPKTTTQTALNSRVREQLAIPETQTSGGIWAGVLSTTRFAGRAYVKRDEHAECVDRQRAIPELHERHAT